MHQHDVKSCLTFWTNKMPTMSTGCVIVLPPANKKCNEKQERIWIPDIPSQRFQVMTKTHKHYCRSPNEIPLKHAQGSPIYSDDDSKKFVLSDLPFLCRHLYITTITTKLPTLNRWQRWEELRMPEGTAWVQRGVERSVGNFVVRTAAAAAVSSVHL
jgi:hypothetical protein